MSDQTDLVQLLRRIAAGEQAAIERLYDLTINAIYALARRVTGHEDVAEEVVNDVYLQIWRQAGTYDATRASPMAWMLLLCRTRAIDWRRRRRVDSQHDDLDDHPLADGHQRSPDELCQDGEQRARVARAVARLSDAQRQAVALAFYRGMSHQEIAEYTGQPLGTIKSVLRRAQELLRAELSDFGSTIERRYDQAR